MRFKKAQAEVIVTILLILIGIAAVVIVGSFVMNLVRDNLSGTECFDAISELSINDDSTITYYNSTSKTIYFGLTRGSKEFNLSGIVVVYGDKRISQNKELKEGATLNELAYWDISGVWKSGALSLPKQGESRAYYINLTSQMNVTQITVYPMLENYKKCSEKADEATVKSVI